MKKFLNVILIILIFAFFLLAGFILFFNLKNTNSGEEDLQKKVKEEIYYLDSNLILLLNDLNNISYEDYKVQTDAIQSASDPKEMEGKSSSGEEQSGSENTNSSEEKSIQQSKMVSNNILNNTRGVSDWNQIKQTAETIYSSWAVIELDLHALTGNAEPILQFSEDLKVAILDIKNEEKEKALISLANSYATLTKLVESYETDHIEKLIFYTKANILNAYSIVDVERWEESKKYLEDAENSFSQIVNDVSVSPNNQADVSKVYVLIQEMKKSIELKEPDLFYINYKNAMQSIENIS